MPKTTEVRVGTTVRLQEELLHRFKVALVNNREKAQDIFEQAVQEYVEKYERGLK